MSPYRLSVATMFLSTFAAAGAFAQTTPDPKPAAAPAQAGAPSGMKGLWVGFALVNGDQRPVKFAFDSTADGWVGATQVPEIGPDSVYLDRVTVKRDSVTFAIPFGNESIGVRGALSGNVYTGEFIIQGAATGSLRMARAGTAEAANLLTPPMELLDESSRATHRR